MKTCIKCEIQKNLTEFYKRKNSKDGYRNQCKICHNKIHKKYMKNHQQLSSYNYICIQCRNSFKYSIE